MKDLLRQTGIAMVLMAGALSVNGLTAVNVQAAVNQEDLFTDRDLEQTPDLEEAETFTVVSGENIYLADEGVYVLTGEAADASIIVEADKEAKVQLVLDGLKITNSNQPCIEILSGDKVFITTMADSRLQVTGAFENSESGKADAVIYSKSDLVLNGEGNLMISSTDKGIVSKDDLKITGGTYSIYAESSALRANDSIRIADGNFGIQAGSDALHAENNDDDTLGNIYILGGNFAIEAADDGIHGTALVEIDGGTFRIQAAEGIEGTYIRIVDGDIAIQSRDDGINAAQKSTAFRPTFEMTGGTLSVEMGSGDTDAIDSNGDLVISGGTISVTANSAFDCDGSVSFTGGTVFINGQQVDTIPVQNMGWGRGGQMQGQGRRGGW